MYKLQASDGNVYGPVTAEQLKQWIAEGRCNANSKIQAEGSQEWKTLADFPEFADSIRPAGPPPTLPSAASDYPAKTSGLAIASLICGILGFFCAGISALVGLILGIIAIVTINKSNGRLRGSGLAIAGTVVSAIVLLVLPALLLRRWPKRKRKLRPLTA